MSYLLAGLIIGACSGFLQFILLAKFAGAVTGEGLDNKTALLGAMQFFLPLVVLLCCAFLLYDSLVWAAVGMAASLVACALIRFVKKSRQR